MQLVGIGIAKSPWNSLVTQLQKQVSHQLNSKLFDDSGLYSESETATKEFKDVPEEIVKLKPDWILFSPGAFEAPEVCLKILEELQNKSEKNVRYVMVIDDLHHDISALLELQPVIELVNKMQFKLSAPELLLTHHIRSFPRIRLDLEFETMDYSNYSGTLVRQSASDVPLNTLVPLKNIRKFETKNGDIAPEIWLQNFLQTQDKVVHPEQVVGILREKNGCYLFPGIPFNSIQNLKFGNTKIEHLIRQGECTLKNPPFKRFIANMKQEHKTWLKEKESSKIKMPPIYCLAKYQIVNALLKKLFREIGQTNVKLISAMNSAEELLKDSVRWLKLDDFPENNFNAGNIDWNNDLSQILAQLVNFVDLNDLQIDNNSAALPIPQVEFEILRKNLLSEEAELESTIRQSESANMLYAQEQDVLQKIASFSKLLLDALATSRSWEDTVESAQEITLPKMLLLCEDENLAADLNLKLTEVQRKLWINPYKFQQVEDLTQLNTIMIRSYLKPEALIITTAARIHLDNLCRQALEQSEKAETVFNEQNEKIKHAKTDLDLIQKNKQSLALRWLQVSLKQLIYRDRHLFQTIPDKAA